MRRQPREWEGVAFDPEALRVLSVLPEADADEAYCIRHDREMRSVDSVVHSEGALYMTTAEFTVYTCPQCLAEAAAQTGTEAVEIYRHQLAEAFGVWDRGEAAGDWFRYVGEVDEYE